MTTPLTENPAVVDPMRTLTAPQRDAISSLAFFRHQRIDGGEVTIGTKRFSFRTIRAIENYQLVQRGYDRGRQKLSLTMAGKLVAEKLKNGGRDGTA
ncbi:MULTISPECIES: hypothetical protein [unclassified Rhizobium]|uniref:hypothetical protein n=1 Tax=unclassified Rhizobium TaxID=2613769 RepID=UPI00161AF841|nr:MULTISPECIES: hypothetical protein [unclassified Rhizobium]MBB3386018.1 hypothetical protein [Rhizobium sp. BK098]MBB3617805.1 hypothetical protein [Rhizobium sp. BK609]MBB3683380.1 hypothetical protein [Rhizobium sp. BK612]